MLKQPQSTGKIYVAEPWASLLVTGKKEIETAHTRLPAQYIGRWLDVQAAGTMSYIWSLPGINFIMTIGGKHLAGRSRDSRQESHIRSSRCARSID